MAAGVARTPLPPSVASFAFDYPSGRVSFFFIFFFFFFSRPKNGLRYKARL
jgi:hypothetical protein